MKKQISLLIAVATCVRVFAQWSGTDPLSTYSLTGVGTTTPEGQVEITDVFAPGSSSTDPNVPSAPGGFLHKGLVISRLWNGSTQSSGITYLYEPLFLCRSNYTSTSGNYTTHMIIDRLGNVGLGIPAPAAQLHVFNNFLVSNTTKDIFKVNSNGNVNIWGDLIFTDASGVECRIYADGTIRAREVNVDLNAIPPDYVFGKDYKLMPIKKLSRYLATYRHLPGIPTASQMQGAGCIAVGDMELKLLEKVEELTLYIVELQKQIDELKKTKE